MLWCMLAHAQTLPQVESTVPPRYPVQALLEARASAVELQLTVDPQGAVTQAVVLVSGGEDFDAAALDAVRAMRFKPALDATGTPSFAEITYVVRFDPQLAPVPAIEGRVRLAGSQENGVGLILRAERGDVQRFATTDDEGRYVFAGLDPGTWTLVLDSPGYEVLSRDLEVREGTVAQATFRPKLLRPWQAEDPNVSEVVVVEQRPPAVEVSERALSIDDIKILPGTGGDVVKAVQNLPGIARPPFNIGQLLIRGTSPEDSAYYLDGARLPAVFHFAGLSTVINGDLLNEVALLSGNYSARYGRTLGGLVDLRTNDRLPKRSRGYVSVDVLQATGFIEQKVGEKTSITVSGRRSYIDTVLSPVLSSGATTVRAPRYYDLQVRVLHHSDQGVLDAAFLLSDDTFKVVGDTEDPDAVAIGLTDRFQKGRIRWTNQFGAWEASSDTLFGPEIRTFQLGKNGTARESNLALNQRLELVRGYNGGWLSARMGLDLYMGSFSYLYDIEQFGVREQGSVAYISPSPYLEPSVRFGPVELTAGLRADPWILDEGYTALAVDPRGVARITPTDGTTIELAAGQFSQFAGIRQSIDRGPGNPDLGPSRSLQVSAGIEQKLWREGQIELTAFGSRLTRLVVGREDAFRFFTGPPPAGPLDTAPYANDGTGRVFGVEMLLKWQSKRTLAWLAATVSRSDRRHRPDEPRELFTYDQPVILNALVSYQLPKNWRVGARARFGSGNPFNPVTNRIYELDDRSFTPVYSLDTARLPPFFSLDVRIDKEFTFRTWAFTVYLDVQNATNRKNPDLMGWTDDYEQEEPIAGLPILPAFGLKAAW